MAVVGKRLKSARENKRLSQIEAAKILGISNGTLSGYERNYRDPDTGMLEKMADLYEVSIDYLLGRSNTEKSEIDDEKEMMEFFNNPRLNLFFKEMADSPEEQLEELQEFWEIIKKRGLNKK